MRNYWLARYFFAVAAAVAVVASGCALPSPVGWTASAQAALNLPTHTLGGAQFWQDHRVRRGWRLQRSATTDRWRVLDPDDIRRGWGSLAAMERVWRQEAERAIVEADRREGQPEKIVIFIHGMLQPKQVWDSLQEDVERRAQREGRSIEAWAYKYPSTQVDIEEAAEGLIEVLDALPPRMPLVFVCHSAGGLVLNTALTRRGRPATSAPSPVEAIVYIGTPFAGSATADWVRHWTLYKLIYGPAGQQLTAAYSQQGGYAWPDCHTVCVGGSLAPEGFLLGPAGDDDGMVPLDSALPLQASERLTVPGVRHGDLTEQSIVREKILEMIFQGPNR
jgi:hypothetical protein